MSARRTSGRTPMDPTTSSPGITRPSPRVTPLAVTSETATPVSTTTPWEVSSAATRMASSGSSGVRIWSTASTTVTAIDLCARFSAVSSPMNPATDDHGTARTSRHVGCEPFRVFDRAQHASPFEARYGGSDRDRTGTQHELVVPEGLGSTVNCGARGDLVISGIDTDHLGVDPDVETEPIKEGVGRLKQQVVLILDHTPDEIGEPAIGVGHMARPFDDRDHRALVEPAETCRRRHSPGDATHDDDP